MFTGIIESVAEVLDVTEGGTNKIFSISNPFGHDVHVDQSIAHNGVCLTVTEVGQQAYKVTAVLETLQLSNLSGLKVGDHINLERCMTLDNRLDGHIVQGHVDTTAIVDDIETLDGSWYYTFQYDPRFNHHLIPKGSIAVNGVSLTVVDPTKNTFRVAIIPFTFEHTNFQYLKPGDPVNIEFDMLGKYVIRYLENMQKKEL